MSGNNAEATPQPAESSNNSQNQEGLPELPQLSGEITQNTSQQENAAANQDSNTGPSNTTQTGVISTGTLSIQDLINVQGVNNPPTQATQQGSGSSPEEDEDKDGDG